VELSLILYFEKIGLPRFDDGTAFDVYLVVKRIEDFPF